MEEPYIGEIRIFPWNLVPRGWAACDGAKQSLTDNPVLYKVIGDTYGGDGSTYFNLPNLVGTVPVGVGQADGPDWSLGETDGVATVTLTEAQLPAHSHGFYATSTVADVTDSAGNQLGQAITQDGDGETTSVTFYSAVAPATDLATGSLATVGGGGQHPNMMPYLALNYCIAVQGQFPPAATDGSAADVA